MASDSYVPQITPEFVARTLHLTLQGLVTRPKHPFTRVTSDSRQITQGCLFIALKGELHDGHEFIQDALARGARGILCRRGFPISGIDKNHCVFPVEDTLAAYRRLAAGWRREFSIPVIAVAGSVGKTTTKELLASILTGKWPHILKTQGSQNGFVGIPLTLLELRSEHGAAVIEVGIDETNAMQQHMAIVAATGAVLTAIGPEHLEKLRDIPTVAREEGIALSSVAHTGGLVAINLDDPWIRPHYQILRVGRKIAYSLTGLGNDTDTLRAELTADGRSLRVYGRGVQDETFALPLPGRHNASNLLGAIAVAVGLGLTPQEIRKGLSAFKGADGRSELRELPGPTPVVCDYYNANPSSMEAGLDLLALVSKSATGGGRQRWACLADMLELGRDEERFHRELANKIIQLQLENVLLYGPRMQALHAELQAKGFRGKARHFENQAGLADALVHEARPGDAILIKGSRGMKMEEVWKRLEPHANSEW